MMDLIKELLPYLAIIPTWLLSRKKAQMEARKLELANVVTEIAIWKDAAIKLKADLEERDSQITLMMERIEAINAQNVKLLALVNELKNQNKSLDKKYAALEKEYKTLSNNLSNGKS
jgi:archaellum component FlaC